MTTTANTAADTTARDTVAVTETNRSRPRELTDRERRNEATMRRIYAEIFDQGQLELIEQLMAPTRSTTPHPRVSSTAPIRSAAWSACCAPPSPTAPP
jgi:hypothetical protein